MANTIKWRAVDEETSEILAEGPATRAGSWEEVNAECGLRDLFRFDRHVTLERVDLTDDNRVTVRKAAGPAYFEKDWRD